MVIRLRTACGCTRDIYREGVGLPPQKYSVPLPRSVKMKEPEQLEMFAIFPVRTFELYSEEFTMDGLVYVYKEKVGG